MALGGRLHPRVGDSCAWKNRHRKNRHRGERSQEIHRGAGRNTGTTDTRLGPRLQALFCPPSSRAAAWCPPFNIISHPPASSRAVWSFSWSPPAESRAVALRVYLKKIIAIFKPNRGGACDSLNLLFSFWFDLGRKKLPGALGK